MAILIFPIDLKNHKLGRGRLDLASFEDALYSLLPFKRRSPNCDKLTTDGGRTTHDQNSALDPSAHLH